MNEDMLISYALGHLTPEEEAAVELHLQRTPQDAAKVAAYLETLAELVFDLEPEPLVQGGEEALLARVRGASRSIRPPPVVVLPIPERRPEVPAKQSPWSWGAWRFLAAAALVALIYVGVRVVPTTEPFLAWQLRRYETQPGAVTYTLAAAEAERPLGTLVRLSSGRVYVSLQQPPESGRVYQAWDIAEAPVGIGTFDGRSYLSDTAVAEGNTFGLTLEPPGGSEQPTTAPITLLTIPD